MSSHMLAEQSQTRDVPFFLGQLRQVVLSFGEHVPFVCQILAEKLQVPCDVPLHSASTISLP